MTISIVGLGTWLPEEIRTNDAWPASFGQRAESAGGDRIFNDIPRSQDDRAAAILERDLRTEASDPFLGAKRRHVAPEAIGAAEAESFASLRALSDARISPEEVDLVITQSLVPDRLGPPSAPAVAHRIGARRALALTVDSACSSSITQIQVAQAYLESGLAKVVLLTQSHLLLRAFPLLHPATPGLGDGSAAMVITRGDRGLRVRSVVGATHGEFALSVCWIRGIDDETDPAWYKPGGGFRLGSRDPQGAKLLMRETVTFGARTVQEAALAAGIETHAIRVLASVQPRGFIPGAIAERLGLARSQAVTTYEETAHIGACGPAFNLAEARAQGRLALGDLVALYGQGAGFTRAAAIVEVTEKRFTS